MKTSSAKAIFRLVGLFVSFTGVAPATATPKTTVIFDLGGVMVDEADAGYGPFLADLLQVPLSTVRKAYAAAEDAVLVGRQSEEEEFSTLAAQQGGTLPADWQTRWEQHYLAVTPMRPAMQQLVRCLQPTGYVTPLLSDTTPLHAALNQARGAYALFAPVLLSHEIHLRKPAAKTFVFALKTFGVEADRCVFIDDRAVNVEGAKSVGIDGIVFEGVEQLQAELQARGIRACCR